MWEIDDFADMNPAGKGQCVSPLQHLTRIAAANGFFLGIAREIIEKEPSSVICFAQLPTTLVSKQLSMVRPGSSRLFKLHFYPAIIQVQDDGSQKLLDPNNEPVGTEGINCTQVLGVVKLWGVRAKWYKAYKRKVTESGLGEGIIVTADNSWLDTHQPLDAAAYENELGRRLLLDYLEAIRSALPLETRNSYNKLLNYFSMPCPGRIAFGGKPVPTLRYIQQGIPPDKPSKTEASGEKTQSVFLSYGGPDKEIAEAIRRDLKKRGVNTWWFPEDAQWGEKIHHEISRNIKAYDRLLLLCSRRSLIRNGVLHELEEVFEREAAEGGRAIVIPVAIDDVLDIQWWLFEPGPFGEPIEGNLDFQEQARRERLATTLRGRVSGDLKDTNKGETKWNGAIEYLMKALSKYS